MIGETFAATPVTNRAHVLIEGLMDWAVNSPRPTPRQLMVLELINEMTEASGHAVEMHCWVDHVDPGNRCRVCGEIEPE